MTISRNGPRPIHLVSVVGACDSFLLPHLIDHYRAQGVESFCLVRHAESASDPGYELIAEHARAKGVPLFHSHIGRWGLDLQQRLFRYAMDEHPDDWFVVADCDELQLYDRPLPELVRECEIGEFDYVSGCFLDRVSSDGGFPEAGPGDLWEQYPLAGSISATLLCALPMKVGLARGRVELLTGQHGAPLGAEFPQQESVVQVNHFKWTGDIVTRLHRRVRQYDDGRLPDMHPSMVRESRRFVSHVGRNNGRIGIADPRLRLTRCGPSYGAHPKWSDIVYEAQGWKWTLR